MGWTTHNIMLLVKQIPILLFIAFLGGKETLNYTINFWGLTCVDVEMILEEKKEHNIKLKFLAKTRNIMDYFFPINNQYTTWYDKELFSISKYVVSINQPNADYNYELTWNNRIKQFSTSEISYSRPEKSHNIFSLLMRARNMEWEQLDTSWWPIEHDGKPYQGRYLWVDSLAILVGKEQIFADHFRFDIQKIKGDYQQLNEISDVFSWAIVLDNCIRQIWVERYGKRRILKAEVTIKGFNLRANLINE